MEDGEACPSKDGTIPDSAEEIRLRRLAYFENAQKAKPSDQLKSSDLGEAKRQTQIFQTTAGKRIPEQKTHHDAGVSGKANVKKTTEFHVQASSSRNQTKHSRGSSVSEEVVIHEVYKLSKTPGEFSSKRRGSTSSVSDDDAGRKPVHKPSQLLTKPSLSGGVPRFSQTSTNTRNQNVTSKDGNKLFEERSHKVTKSVRISGDSEVEGLFSNRRWVSANEIPALSLKDSVDVDGVSVFKSSANFDDLGLSTHRPESNVSAHDFVDRRRMTRQRSLSSENLLVGKTADEIRSVLGEQKYREFVEKSDRDLNQLHAQKFHDHPPAAHSQVNGEIRSERLSRKDSPARNTPTPPPQPPSPISSSGGRRGPSPRRRLRSSSPQQVSRTLQDIARHNQARDVTSSRNYEQVVVPHNTTFSADEIYRQAYGGNSGSASDRSAGGDVRRSSATLASSYNDGASSFWNNNTPRQMAGLMSPSSTHASSAYPGPFSPVSAPGPMHHPAMQMHHPVYPNANSNPGYMYTQGVPMSPGARGQYMYPVQQSMFMPVSAGTPPSPDTYMFPPGHPLSHSMPGYHNGNLGSPVGSPWQHFTQYPPPSWGPYMASGERNNSYSGPPGWPEGPVPVMVPQPPPAAAAATRGDQHDARFADNNRGSVDSAARHAEGVRQHHEHKRLSQERQSSQNPSNFSSASLERYFASLAPPSHPPPPYHLHVNHHHDNQQGHVQETSRARGEASVRRSEDEDTLVEQTANDDNMTTVTGTSVTTATNIKAGGITERLEELNIDPAVLQQLKWQSEKEASDEATLDAMRNCVRVCPECQAVNKEYMTWCLQCGGVLIGVEPIPARNLKKKNKQKQEVTTATKSSSKTRTVDTTGGSSSYQVSPDKCDLQDGIEPWTDYTEKDEETGLEGDVLMREHDSTQEASQSFAKRDTSYAEEHYIEEEDISENKESPESGKGPSATSSPVRKAGSRDNLEDSEDPLQDTLEVTENKDSGRPSSGEELDARKSQAQPAAEGPSQRTQKEISDICGVISDPIIRGFIKNYLQKRPSVDEKPDSSWPVGEAHQAQGGNKQNDLSNSLTLDLGASISSTAPAAVALQNAKGKGAKSPEKRRKNSKGKGHEAIDVEIFGLEEAKLCRSARSGANIVPMLNLVHSSDEEDDSSEKTSSVTHAGASTTEPAEPQSPDESEHAPVSYDLEVQAIAGGGDENGVQSIASTQNANQSDPTTQNAGNRGTFLQHLVERESIVGMQPVKKKPQARPQQPRKQSPVSKVRASIEAPQQNRRWARSSIAWSSFHPRELSTRSSMNFARGGGRGPAVNVRASRSTDNLTNSSHPDLLPSQRQRPASADQHNRRMPHQARPISAGRGGRAHSAQVAPPAQSWQQVESRDSVGDQQPVERSRPLSSQDNGTIPSPRFPESADHRLPIQEDTLPLIPTGPSTALKIYDRCTELTPRIEEGALSKWLCLPDELWLHVFSYLPQADLFRVALTCKQLYRIALDDTLWKVLTVKKKTVTKEWLTQIAQRHPVSLALVQCHGENIDLDALRELFREVAPHLKELNFSRCSRGVLTGDNILLHASARCRGLTHVDASWCHVTDNGLSALAECCHRLESLCLNGCQMITDESLEIVLKKHGQSLRVLEMFGCFGLTQNGFRSLATYCTFLLTLNIGQCHKVTDSCVATLSASLGRVENLDLRGCKQIKDNCIRKIVRNCPRLRMLTLANCPSISDAAIVEIATYLGDIRILDVCGCRNVTDTSIRTLANNCGRLTSLDISSTSCTHKSALLLANYSRCLESAKFNFLPDVSEACLFKLIKNCKRLNTIHLYGCNNIRDVSRLKMLNRFLHIEM